MVLISRSWRGLQRHLHVLDRWCTDNMLEVGPSKSRAMIFGKPDDTFTHIPQFEFHGSPIAFTSIHHYVGVTLRSTHANIFHDHYTQKAQAAKSAAMATLFGTDAVVGRGNMPPNVATQLYSALVDCHLIHACEIMPDVDAAPLALLRDVQKLALRRVLGLGSRCTLSILFTETGLDPIDSRRAILTLRYLKYLIGLPVARLAARALRVSDTLRLHGNSSWLGDLDIVIRSLLPGFHSLPSVTTLTPQDIDDLISRIRSAVKSRLLHDTETMTSLYVLRGRLEPFKEGPPKSVPCVMRHYLTLVSVPSHRLAITRLLLGGHSLRGVHSHPGPVESFHGCRWCHASLETVEHALLECTAQPSFVVRRDEFWAAVSCPLIDAWRASSSPLTLLRRLAFSREYIAPLAAMAYTIGKEFGALRTLPTELTPEEVRRADLV